MGGTRYDLVGFGFLIPAFFQLTPLGKRNCVRIIAAPAEPGQVERLSKLPSSSGLGRRPLTAVTPVRIR